MIAGGLALVVPLLIMGASAAHGLLAAASVTRFAGTGSECRPAHGCGDGGPATQAQLFFPAGVAADRHGNVYIADSDSHEVREVLPDGTITRVAGTGTQCTSPPRCGDGGPATSAELDEPVAIAVDAAMNVYVADSGDREVRKVSAP
jgi:hypothetical protein